MQVFIIGSPLETAMELDPKRLNRQIQETKIILAALNGAKAWSNHPCVLQYRGYEKWLEIYKGILMSYEKGEFTAILHNMYVDKYRPAWHTQEYYDQMKRRLYTKDPEHYKQWAHLGESQENWYWSEKEGAFIKYVNGKRIE
jgi:hypothetical protein